MARGLLKIIEREKIFNGLRVHYGSRTKTAEALGISVSTIQRKIREYKKDGYGNCITEPQRKKV
jgi:transcriptional regulator with PAS, ATPase and Fis domain